MPAVDQCHDQVVNALQKDGWTLLNAPLRLPTPDRSVFVDLQITRGVNGTRQQIMLVEVKCFPDRTSSTTDLYIAFGQYLIYRAILAELNDSTPLYLSVPHQAFNQVFDKVVQRAVDDARIKLVVINLEMEIVEQWIPPRP